MSPAGEPPDKADPEPASPHSEPLLEPDSLRDYFSGRLPGRLRELEDAWLRVRETGWGEDAVRTFHRLAHSLVGAGATFGFAAVTEASRALERRLKPVLQGQEPPLDPTVVDALLAALRQAAGRPAS